MIFKRSPQMRLKTVSLVCIGYILGVLLHHHLSFHLPEDADHCENSKFDAFISIHGLSKSRHLPTLPSPSNIYVGKSNKLSNNCYSWGLGHGVGVDKVALFQ